MPYRSASCARHTLWRLILILMRERRAARRWQSTTLVWTRRAQAAARVRKLADTLSPGARDGAPSSTPGGTWTRLPPASAVRSCSQDAEAAGRARARGAASKAPATHGFRRRQGRAGRSLRRRLARRVTVGCVVPSIGEHAQGARTRSVPLERRRVARTRYSLDAC